MAGGSWHVLFLSPLVVRLAAQAYYQRNASINTARSFYEKQQAPKQLAYGNQVAK